MSERALRASADPKEDPDITPSKSQMIPMRAQILLAGASRARVRVRVVSCERTVIPRVSSNE